MDLHILDQSIARDGLGASVLQVLGKNVSPQKPTPAVERRAAKDKQKGLNAMRAKLPKLSKAEIRRVRLPLYEALVAELYENNYPNAAIFMTQLFNYQRNYRAEHSYDVIIQARPVLIDDEPQLLYLYNSLMQAEGAHYKGGIQAEIDTLLKVAFRYSFGSVDWWWLGEQFFAQCLSITEEYHEDGNFRHTMAYYLYGKYLIEQPRIIPLGMQFLNIAREYSMDEEWTAGKITGKIEKYIFVEVCTVLYRTLMDQAKLVLRKDPAWALELVMEARQRGIEACLPRADVFFLLGQAEMANKQSAKAVGDFMKAFLLYKTNQQMEQCCEAMIGLAQAFQDMGNLYQNKEQLEKLLEFAQKQGLKSYIGQAYLYIGQYFLNAGTPESATPYLTNALNIFIEINDVVRREFVKNLGAVSKGQETFQSYVKLILRCENSLDIYTRRRNLMRLLKWKDKREPFWDDMTESLSEGSMVEEEEMPMWEEFKVERDADAGDWDQSKQDDESETSDSVDVE